MSDEYFCIFLIFLYENDCLKIIFASTITLHKLIDSNWTTVYWFPESAAVLLVNFTCGCRYFYINLHFNFIVTNRLPIVCNHLHLSFYQLFIFSFSLFKIIIYYFSPFPFYLRRMLNWTLCHPAMPMKWKILLKKYSHMKNAILRFTWMVTSTMISHM